jgi:hypothetical protein
MFDHEPLPSGEGLPAVPPGVAAEIDEEERCWKAGSFYVNRKDTALFVPKRFGTGWTLNLGNPLAWAIFLVPTALVILSIVLARGCAFLKLRTHFSRNY